MFYNVSWPGFFTTEITPADGIVVLIIHHDGASFFPCDCEETMFDILYAWVKKYWEDCNSEKPITDFSRDDAISEYFDENDNEYWDSDYVTGVYSAEDAKAGRVSM